MPNMLQADPKLLYVLLKGGPGLRKSTTALSFPGSQYWFSWDKKMQSMILPMRYLKLDPTKIDYDDYTDWSSAETKLKQLQSKCDYDNLIFDSITSLGDSALGQVMTFKGAPKKDDEEKKKERLVGGIQVNELEDFNAESSAIMKLISMTKDIQTYNKKQYNRYINIILIAHILEVTHKPLTGPMTVSSTIVTAAKKNAAKIPAYCSEVYHFGIKRALVEGQGGKLLCVTHNTGDDFARTSLPLPREIEVTDANFYNTHIAPAIRKLSDEDSGTGGSLIK